MSTTKPARKAPKADPDVYAVQSAGSFLMYGEFSNTNYQDRYKLFTPDRLGAWPLVQKLALDYYGLDIADCDLWGDLNVGEEGYSSAHEAQVYFIDRKSKERLGELQLTGYSVDGTVYCECDGLPIDTPGIAAKNIARARNLPEDWVAASWHITKRQAGLDHNVRIEFEFPEF